MKIVTTEQAVLDLILNYWDNPSAIAFKSTLQKIREHWPITEHSMSLDWEFKLSPEPLVNLSRKYLNQDFQMNGEWYILEVDSTNLSMRILSMEDYMKNLPRKMSRTYLGI